MTSITLPFILAKFSHRMVIIFGATIATAGAFGMAFAQNLPILYFAVFVSFVGASFVHVPGEDTLADMATYACATHDVRSEIKIGRRALFLSWLVRHPVRIYSKSYVTITWCKKVINLSFSKKKIKLLHNLFYAVLWVC